MAQPRINQRNYGYYQWDEEDAYTTLWERRFSNIINETLQVQTALDNHRITKEDFATHYQPLFEERDAISNKLMEFASKLGEPKFDIKYFIAINRGNQSDLGFNFGDGQTRTLPEMPAGYRRLYSIVLDLAYRSYIINKTTDSKGIAIIDEIDLHLHPELEQRIVDVFRSTFPNIQFIVTTHSPLVISNVDTSTGINSIISVNESEEVSYIHDTYGLDYDSSLTDIMGVSLRSSEIESIIDSYIILTEAGYEHDANDMKKILLDRGISEELFTQLLTRKNNKS